MLRTSGKNYDFVTCLIPQSSKVFASASFCTNSKDDGTKVRSNRLKLPEEPQNCCMSGCANCVWVAYAEELAKILNDGGEKARQKIMEHVKDPNLRAFLMLELQHLFKKK